MEQPLIQMPNHNPFTMNATGRLSYSSMQDLQSCERFFQLEYLLANEQTRQGKADFSFGHAFGEGVAHYLVYQDRDAAITTAWLAYWPQLETEKKTQTIAVNLLTAAFTHLDTVLQDYEVVSYKGKPASELSFKMRIDEKYYFAGHIDVVLRNRWTGKYAIFEVKTTGLLLHDLSPMYKNSGQALGYSIALDAIAEEDQTAYDIIYFVGQLGKNPFEVRIHTMPFPKTLLDRLNWFITLGLDVQHLRQMEQLNVYPQRGNNCLRFMRPCKHFGTCGFHSLDVAAEFVPDKEVYQLEYDLDTLVVDHIKRLQQTPELGLSTEEANGEASMQTIMSLD